MCVPATISPNRYPDMPSGLSVKKSIVFVVSNYFLRVGDNKTEAPCSRRSWLWERRERRPSMTWLVRDRMSALEEANGEYRVNLKVKGEVWLLQ